MGPGSRVGFLVIGPSPGTYNVSTLPFTTGPGGDDYPFSDLAKVVVKLSLFLFILFIFVLFVLFSDLAEVVLK